MSAPRAAAAAATGAAVDAGAVIHHRRGRDSRSYRFLPGEPLPDAIRRVARGRIDHALDELNGNTDSSPEQAVHEARKDMKKLRSLLRLVRAELGDKRYRRENDRFREAGATLARFRDGDVMLATLDGLNSAPPALRSALEAHRRALAAVGRERRIREVLVALEEGRERIADWPLERDGFKPLREGLEGVQRRGRHAWRAVEREPTTEALHEWRKRVKDRWYLLNLLGDAWPAPLKAEADEAHALSDRLGEDHDLAVLQGWAHEHLGDDDLDGLDDEVERRRTRLQAEAIALGRRLFAERPRDFRRRIADLWKVWGRAPAEPGG